MKILELTAIDRTVFYFLVPLMKAMKREAWDVHFACAPGEKARRVEDMGFTFHPIRTTRRPRPGAMLAQIRDTYRLLKTEDFQVVHLHTPLAAFLGRIAARAAGTPRVIYTVHGFYHHPDMFFLKRWFFALLEIVACSWATDALFVLSRQDFHWIARRVPKRVKVMHLGSVGVNTEFFSRNRVSQETLQALRAQLGAGRIVLASGRAVREKGFFELVDASARVLREAPDALFVLAGDGPDLAGLRARAKAAGVGGRWRFLGWREDVRELLALAEVFVLPSWREGMPRSILEAMSMGVPVVATDIRGCREEVVPGETGLLVEPKAPDQLARAIIRILGDRSLAGHMRAKARQRALALFEEARVIQKQTEAIESLWPLLHPAGTPG